MSVEQLEAEILSLSPEERQRLAVWVEKNRQKVLGDGADDLSVHHMAEVLRRREMALAHPDLLEPWDGTIERVRARLNEARRSKASAG